MQETITLKDDFTFLVSDRAGEVLFNPDGHGLYFQDTRYLSRLELLVDSKKPELLSSNPDYNIAATFHLSSAYLAQFKDSNQPLTPAVATVTHGVSLIRRRYIRRGLLESIELTNFNLDPVTLTLTLQLGADFTDIFEVRGLTRNLQGDAARLRVQQDGRVVEFTSIPTLPGVEPRYLRFESNLTPRTHELSQEMSQINRLYVPQVSLHYQLELPPNQPFWLTFSLIPGSEPGQSPEPSAQSQSQFQPAPAADPVSSFALEASRARQFLRDWEQACTRVSSPDYMLNKTIRTSLLDLRSLMQQEKEWLVVTAGLPWYFTLFGRDSLITSIQALAFNPAIAVDTLRALAFHQATDYNDWRDSEPGKILHELRQGDLTLGGEMPHGPYYGSIDSTLLFIICFVQALKWTGDPALFAELWPAVARALQWAEQYGEIDDSGYIKFRRRSPRGILHPGWKDSDESMGGAIGPRPQHPVALVEVQGYYYEAQHSLAATLRRYGNDQQKELAARLETRAARLKANFNRDFWWGEEGFLYQALDGQNQPIRSITSNPGHCLWSGIVDADKAPQVVDRLMQPDLLSGWGLRTMSTLDRTYNPMSYHNGSIWPHDNSLVIAGMRRYGFDAEAGRVARQILDAAITFPENRLPELYCGFPRIGSGVEEYAPAAYPVSCSPQAWAAGTALLVLQTLLGLDVDTATGQPVVAPVQMEEIKDLTLHGLRVGNARLDLSIRYDPATGKFNPDFRYDPLENAGNSPANQHL